MEKNNFSKTILLPLLGVAAISIAIPVGVYVLLLLPQKEARIEAQQEEQRSEVFRRKRMKEFSSYQQDQRDLKLLLDMRESAEKLFLPEDENEAQRLLEQLEEELSYRRTDFNEMYNSPFVQIKQAKIGQVRMIKNRALLPFELEFETTYEIATEIINFIEIQKYFCIPEDLIIEGDDQDTPSFKVSYLFPLQLPVDRKLVASLKESSSPASSEEQEGEHE